MIHKRTHDDVRNSWKRTLYITFIAQLMSAIGFSSINPFLSLYVKDLGTNTNLSIEFLAGMVFSAQAFTMMIASPIWGMVADRYGRKLMVERAMFGGSAILLLMAFAHSAETLVILRAIQGVITGSISATNTLVASVTPRRHTGYAMGVLQVGAGIGVAVGPMIGGVIADFYGYNTVYYVTAGLLFLSGVLVLLGVEEIFVQANLLNGEVTGFLSGMRNILSTPGVVVTYSLRFITELGQMMLIPILPLFIITLLKETSRLNTFTGFTIAIGSITMILSAIYLGRLGDRIGHSKIFIICSVAATLLYLPLSIVVSGWQLLFIQALVGIAIGGIIPCLSALLAQYTLPGEEGVVYGLNNSIRAGARSIAPLIGSGVAIWLGLRATFTVAALFFLMSAVLAAWRLPQTKIG